jgi:tripartite-type tricarboxylate transporter receptor subunit TctC
MDTMKDPELIAEADKMKIGVNAKSGEEIAKIIAKTYASSPELIKRTKQVLRP